MSKKHLLSTAAAGAMVSALAGCATDSGGTGGQ
mgnify:FL=1